MEIYQFFHEILGLTNDNSIEKLQKVSEFKMVKRKELLIKKYEVQEEVYFIVNGFFRVFSYDEKEKERTEYFQCECGQILVTNFVLEDKAKAYIEAVTDSVILKIKVDTFINLMREYPDVLRLYNRILLKSLNEQWKLKEIRYILKAEKRYEWFLSKYIGLDKYVRDKDIASFLGMNPVTLSKIKKLK